MFVDARTVQDPLSDDIVEDELLRALEKIVEQGGSLFFHVRAQNAGVIIGKTDGHLQFESFELAPPNEVVMTAKGRLYRYQT
ncbi:hypothetical protein LTR74_018985 [Friedmanniomyces endolithicus]|nr:hypothetical protein LTR74_018985 [Friedmanniomyces endolithicus]